MSYNRIYFIILLAVALPGQSSSALNAARPCTKSVISPYNDLITNVNIIAQRDENGKVSFADPRGGVTKKGPKIGMTAEEIKQTRTSQGFVTCPGTKYNNPFQGSGSLVGAADTVVTVAHIFIDKQGRYREPLSECYFQNQTPPFKKVKVNVSPGANDIFSAGPIKDKYGELAFIRLVNPVEGAKPYKLYSGNSEIQEHQKMITVSAKQHRLSEPVDISEPIVQKCTVEKTFYNYEERRGIFASDCSSTPGASGSVNLVRHNNDPRGEFEVVGVMTSGAIETQDYKPFKLEATDDPESSFTFSVGIGPTVYDRFVQFQTKRKIETVSGTQTAHGSPVQQDL